MRILVWDWPTRLFHWALAACVAGAWFTASDARLTHLHVFVGYTATALVLFRVAWGFAGTRHARFAAFATPLAVAVRYARDLRRGRARRYITHNPVGALAVWALLTLVVLLAASGLLTLGGQEQQGPLAGVIGRAAGFAVADLHEVIAWTGLLLVGLHVTGVIVEGRIHRESLVRAMLDGRKDGESVEAIASARGGIAVLLLLAIAVFAAAYFRGYATATPQRPYLPYSSPALAGDATWNDECGSCHLAYHPSLLPARSWDAMLAGQADHFGEDLALDADTLATLRAFAAAHSAERGESEAALRIARTVPAGASPLKITETAYGKHVHEDIADVDFTAGKGQAAALPRRAHGRGDCAACHLDAEKATFENGAMRIP